MRDDEVFGGLDDDARAVYVALVSCGGHVSADTVAQAANGRDPAVLDGTYVRTVPNDAAVLFVPADPVPVERWLADRQPLLRDLVAGAVFFDQVRWAAPLADEVTRPDLFAAARRTWDARAVVWRPRPANARKGAPPFYPPQRDPMARLALVASLLDRADAEAREWVAGLLPPSRQEWADHGRDAVVAALPALADLLPEGAAALVAQAVIGNERHGFGWADLARLRDTHPGVFPEDVWDDVRKRFARWAKRRQTYPMNDAARAEMASTADALGVDLG